MNIRFLIPLFSAAVFFASCAPQRQLPNYVNDARDTSGVLLNTRELQIQQNDLLSIQVYSASTRPDISDALYNLPCAAIGTMNAGATSAGGSACGFLVDGSGNIEYPRIGSLHVEGLTKQQLSDLIKFKINEKDSVLTNPSVVVRFQNLKVTIMGEVKLPGVRSFPGERVTILEAIGLAGDVTDFAVRDRVKVIREVNGRREIGIVDLSSTKIFDSPYYNLMQNDVILVDPMSRKAKQQDQVVVYQKISLGLSVITAFALIYNVFRN